MNIKSSVFGGFKLSGKDAKQFTCQVREGNLNSHALRALRRGKIALDKMHERHGTFGEGNTNK
ncbi:hypothetical protein [Moritella sp. F3]|uniref:hypothetical protein n=1 Tax=Moritella sp. F3 TaxID=2718882 RepID=UPI0018E1BF46|nr:hypothetical protein [Moritella sp. F3]GIC77655.1 hypothetical protein FMO001_23820 [Moritella sp. F1]GIC82068.1 hypothetical protein FMO003_23490 [Moritella sp. F3]